MHIKSLYIHIIEHSCVLCLQKTNEEKTKKMMVQTNNNYHDAEPNFSGAYDLKI